MILTVSGAIMLPPLRRQLKTLTNKNQALQDILNTCTAGTRLISVEKVDSKVHNTKITLLVDKGKTEPPHERYIQRVHFYNRLDLADIMVGLVIESKELPAIIHELNLKGYDFTEDDLELVGGVLKAKPNSLGYYGQSTENVKPVIIFDNYDGLMSTETGLLTYTLEYGDVETSKVWAVDDETRLSINPVTGEFTGLLPGIVTVTLTINEFIVGTKTFEVYPYVSIVAPTNLAVTTV